MTGVSNEAKHDGRVVKADQTEFEAMDGRDHHWYVRPDLVDDSNLLAVVGEFPEGGVHPFHKHPNMEELIYLLEGKLEQWVEDEMFQMEQGDTVHIPADMVHASYNAGSETMKMLAILFPADADPPDTVDMSDEEPWCDLR